MGFGNQLLLLLWKNFTLRKRQPLRVVIELVWPLCLFLILVAVRTRPDLVQRVPECHFDGKAMPSAGTFPFLQTYMCTFNNTCHQQITEDEVAGLVDSFNSSVLAKLLSDVENVLRNNTQRKEIFELITDFETLQDLANMIQNGSSVGSISLGKLLINPEQLRQQIAKQNISLSPEAVNTWLNSTLRLQNIVGNFTAGDFSAIQRVAEFVSDLEMPRTAADVNRTLDNLRERVCNESFLTQWFNFANPADARNLQAQLCNLTVTQQRELFEDFRNDISVKKVLDELTSFTTSNTGRQTNFYETYMKIVRITNDIRDLRSLSDLQQDLTDLRSDLMPEPGTTPTRENISHSIGLLFCGRKNSFLGLSLSNNSQFFNSGKNNNPEGRMDISQLQEKTDFHEGEEREDEEKEFTPFCQNLFMKFAKTPTTRIFWRQLKPFVLGVIPYTPDNEATRAIIKKANATFENLASVMSLASDWLDDLSPSLRRYLANSSNIQLLRNFTSHSSCSALDSVVRQARFLPQFANRNLPILNASACDMLNRYLYNGPNTTGYDWRDSLDSLDDIARQVKEYLQCFRFNKFRPFESESALINASMNRIITNTLWAGLVFEMDKDQKTIPSHVSYKIRMNADMVDSTKKIMDRYWRPGSRRRPFIDNKYIYYGFAFLQDMVDHGIIQAHTGVEEEVGVFLQQFPYPCYLQNKFMFYISRSMPLFMVLAWIYSVAMIVKGIVYEKEQRLKEVMKIMGLGNFVHWLAWFINAFIMMLITIILLCIVLKGGRILEHSDPSTVFVFLLAFTFATIMQCFFISVFFSKANLAAVCGGFCYFIMYMPYTLVVRWEERLTTNMKMFTCLSSNVAFGYGCSYLSRFEEQAVGLQWNNIASSPMADDDFSMAKCILMLIIDGVIYGLFTWYIEAVFPGQYGIPRRWYFPIQKSYWCGQRYQSDLNDYKDRRAANMEMNCDKENLEQEPANAEVGVSIHNMTKIYTHGKKLAVDGLSINFYEGQITSFLGHNGAGKTTTMSILTGLFPPTHGTAYINGKDIRSEIDDIRTSLGMCPQHNVLFDFLTVEEHIWFYARLKGQSNADVDKELPQMIKDVGLPNKAKEKSRNLSGGMKRKLSVAIAFVGGSRTVILDEPTAGVDPYARRAIWDLLIKLRENRTIILSTHHMDEADILGDRIAIISQGRLCCCGSSLFLKNRFGSGYYLTLVCEDDNQETGNALVDAIERRKLDPLSRPGTAGSIRSTVDVVPMLEIEDEGYSEMKRELSDRASSNTSSASSNSPTPPPEGATMIPGFSVQRVTAFIQKFVKDAKLIEESKTELSYQLPDVAAHDGSFEHLFSQLEQSHMDLGISSFGISDTSLEEVFLKVTEESGLDEPTDEMTRNTLEQAYDEGKYPRPVTRLSFRNKKKFGLFPVRRVNSSIELVEDTDFDDTARKDDGQVQNTETVCEPEASTPSYGTQREEKTTGWALKRRQFLALLIKRWHHVRRSKKGFFCEIILPAGFVCLGMVFALLVPPFEQEPPLELVPWIYTPPKGSPHLYTFFSNDAPGTTLADGLQNTMLKKPFLGTRCMNPKVYQIKDYPCDSPPDLGKWTARPTLTGNLTIDSPACSCKTGVQQCPAGAGGPKPQDVLLPTTDYLYNMTSRNISDWLVKTMSKYIKKRYGGFSIGDRNPVARLNSTQVMNILDRLAQAANNGTQVINGTNKIATDLETLFKRFIRRNVAKVWYNNKGWAASVSYMSVLNNQILRNYLPPDKDPSDFGITTINHPLNYTESQLGEETLMTSAVDVVVAIFVTFAMSFIPASFVLVLIEDRVSNSKHLQFVSGVNPTIYWLSHVLWDLMNYLIPAVLCIFIFLAFNKEAYVSAKHAPCLVALLFLYGWASIPMMYPLSRLFSVPSSAFVALACGNVFLGTVSTLATAILELLEQEDPYLADVNDILKKLFLLLPHYCLGRGLIDMTGYQLQADIIARFGEELKYDLFDWEIVGRNLFAMFILGIIFFFLNLLIEYRFFIKPRKVMPPSILPSNEDIDVIRERERVLSGGADTDILRLDNLTKVYGARGKYPMTAVDRLCVGVPSGQCFGLLGVNGAGKTTTFKMLTGDLSVTSGSAYVGNKSILKDIVEVRQNIGYCPQFDALDMLLTAREHLHYYGRIRGVPEKDIANVADWAIRKMNLIKYADVTASKYSGGNKRKLSTAIALIGNPSIIFLDEPTTGMDPKARRFLWNSINSIIKDGRSVILTSHSMEECEALCGRLAIMVNGRFKCLGSIQHLKNRFGSGYTVTLRVAGAQPDLEPVKSYISSEFPNAVLKEVHHNMLQYQLGSSTMSLARLFGKIESSKSTLNIESYSVCQTTLDQVFINFAKLQTDIDTDDVDLPADLGILQYEIAMNPNTQRLVVYDEQSVSGSTVGLILTEQGPASEMTNVSVA